jgi:hypothetical protein
MPDRSVLTKSELAVLDHIERQWSGCGLVSRAWLEMCIEAPDPKSPVGFPENQRQLDRCLRQLEGRGFITRVRTQDRGTFHAVTETWNLLSADVRTKIVAGEMTARGHKSEIAVLVLGPAALPEPLKSKIWKPSGVSGPGVVFEFRGLKLGEGSHNVKVGPLPQVIPAEEYRVGSDVLLVNLVFRGPE